MIPEELRHDPLEWSVAEVGQWLLDVLKMSNDICMAFRDHDIDGSVLFSKHFDQNIMKDDLGIKAVGKRIKILDAIDKLRILKNSQTVGTLASIESPYTPQDQGGQHHSTDDFSSRTLTERSVLLKEVNSIESELEHGAEVEMDEDDEGDKGEEDDEEDEEDEGEDIEDNEEDEEDEEDNNDFIVEDPTESNISLISGVLSITQQYRQFGFDPPTMIDVPVNTLQPRRKEEPRLDIAPMITSAVISSISENDEETSRRLASQTQISETENYQNFEAAVSTPETVENQLINKQGIEADSSRFQDNISNSAQTLSLVRHPMNVYELTAFHKGEARPSNAVISILSSEEPIINLNTSPLMTGEDADMIVRKGRWERAFLPRRGIPREDIFFPEDKGRIVENNDESDEFLFLGAKYRAPQAPQFRGSFIVTQKILKRYFRMHPEQYRFFSSGIVTSAAFKPLPTIKERNTQFPKISKDAVVIRPKILKELTGECLEIDDIPCLVIEVHGSQDNKDEAKVTIERRLWSAVKSTFQEKDSEDTTTSLNTLELDELFSGKHLDAIQQRWENVENGDKEYGLQDDVWSDFDEEEVLEVEREFAEEDKESIKNDLETRITKRRKQVNKTNISNEQKLAQITEYITSIEQEWNAKKLPILENKRYYIFLKTRQFLTKERANLAQLEVRKQNLLNELLDMSYTSAAELRRTSGGLDHTVMAILETKWKVALLEGPMPAKPVKSEVLSKPKSKQQAQMKTIVNTELIDPDETDYSESDDSMTDFIVDDGLSDMETFGSSSHDAEKWQNQRRLEKGKGKAIEGPEESHPKSSHANSHSIASSSYHLNRSQETEDELPSIEILNYPDSDFYMQKAISLSLADNLDPIKLDSIGTDDHNASAKTITQVGTKDTIINVDDQQTEAEKSAGQLHDDDTTKMSPFKQSANWARRGGRRTRPSLLHSRSTETIIISSDSDMDGRPNGKAKASPASFSAKRKKLELFQLSADDKDEKELLLKHSSAELYQLLLSRLESLSHEPNSREYAEYRHLFNDYTKFCHKFQQIKPNSNQIVTPTFESFCAFKKAWFMKIKEKSSATKHDQNPDALSDNSNDGDDGNSDDDIFHEDSNDNFDNEAPPNAKVVKINGKSFKSRPRRYKKRIESDEDDDMDVDHYRSSQQRSYRHSDDVEDDVSIEEDSGSEVTSKNRLNSHKRKPDNSTEEEDDSKEAAKRRREIAKRKKISTFRRIRAEDENVLAARRQQRTLDREASRRAASQRLEWNDEDKILINLGHDIKEAPVLVDPELGSRLKKHQVEAIQYMWRQICTIKLGGCILAHSMGLGKTLSVIAFITTLMREIALNNKDLPPHLMAGRILILVPVTIIQNWANEFGNKNAPEDSPQGWVPSSEWQYIKKIYRFEKNTSQKEQFELLEDWYENGGIFLVSYPKFSSFFIEKKNSSNEKSLSDLSKATKYLLEGPSLVIADEGHVIKNELSGISKLVKRFQTISRICMTGYPLQNNLMEYWTMVDFVRPNYLGTIEQFRNQYSNPIKKYWDTSIHDQAITLASSKQLYKLKKVIGDIILRQDATILHNELPQKMEYVVYIKLTDLQYKLYTGYLDCLDSQYDSRSILKHAYPLLLICAHPNWFKRSIDNPISRPRKLAHDARRQDISKRSDISKLSFIVGLPNAYSNVSSNEDIGKENFTAVANTIPTALDNSESSAVGGTIQDTNYLPDEGIESAEYTENLREEPVTEPISRWATQFFADLESFESITYSMKLKIALEIIEECHRLGEKCLFFSRSNIVLDGVEKIIRNDLKITCFRIDGQVQEHKRQPLIDNFNSSPSGIFLLALRSGSLGINLVSANRIIMFDIEWNPCHVEQGIARAYRYGQTKKVVAYRFVSYGTVEHKIFDQTIYKIGMASQVVDAKNVEKQMKEGRDTPYFAKPPSNPEQSLSENVIREPVLDAVFQRNKDSIIDINYSHSLLDYVEEDHLTEQDRQELDLQVERERMGESIAPNAFVSQQSAINASFVSQQSAINASFFPQQSAINASFFPQQSAINASFFPQQSAINASFFPQQSAINASFFPQQSAINASFFPQQSAINASFFPQQSAIITAPPTVAAPSTAALPVLPTTAPPTRTLMLPFLNQYRY